MQLRHLSESDEAAFFAALKAFPDEGHFSFIPSFDASDLSFEEILKKIKDFEQGIDLPAGFVPDSLLFAFNNKGDIVGRCSIRHRLDSFLEKYAGHIGYGVVPAFRRQGYATQILAQALEFSKDQLGLTRVLITCDDTNVASIGTLEANGIYQFSLYKDERLKVAKRHYWVNL